MYLTLATFFTPSTIIIVAVLGLLLFGKELPTMVKQAAKQYFKYKKMINEATSDIQREMDAAANQIEEEKRSLKSQLDPDMPSLNGILDEDKFPVDPNLADSSSGSSDTAANGTQQWHGDAPSKPAADPLALDIPAPSSLSHKATEQVTSAASKVAALDSLKAGVPPPSRIPPPL